MKVMWLLILNCVLSCMEKKQEYGAELFLQREERGDRAGERGRHGFG